MFSSFGIFALVKDGRSQNLKKFLEVLPDDEKRRVVSEKIDGVTPLIVACHNGFIDVVKILVEVGRADINQGGSPQILDNTMCLVHTNSLQEVFPLGVATAAGFVHIVLYLIDTGECQDIDSAMHIACYVGDWTMVFNLYCSENINKNSQSSRGYTPLMIAIEGNHQDIAMFFLSMRADVHLKNELGLSAADLCLMRDNDTILRILIDKEDATINDLNGDSLLLLSAARGCFNSVNTYITVANHIIPTREKIDAMFLLSACALIKSYGGLGEPAKFSYQFLKAMRIIHNDGNWIHQRVEQSDLAKYLDVEEMFTPDEHDVIRTWKSTYMIQGVIILDRILGPHHRETRKLILLLYTRFKNQVELFDIKVKVTVDADYTELEYWKIHYELIMQMYAFLIQLQSFYKDFPGYEFLKDILAETATNLFTVILPFNDAYTPLHFACSQRPAYYDVISFPSQRVAEELIKAGHKMNVMDFNRCTPLGTFVRSSASTSMFTMLLESGEHLDVRDKDGRSPVDRVQEKYSINPLKYVNLQCLCARVIKSNNIRFKEFVPVALVPFIDMH